ncbi:hypothetical protein [Actinoplanes sp. G11-F43]|uniref:hypothetical protein n=1 Tax=Actinoplanes sp. G11-F43 TaxID=3424130 RepID=UPI003D324C25
MSILPAASRFLDREARLLERRLFAGDRAGVVRALRAHQNDDGGFGHGLEPDKRCPASLPIDAEVAFQALATVGAAGEDMVRAACDYLTTVTVDGAVPLASPVIEDYPRAAHWTDWTYVPGVNPTAGLAGLLHRLGVDHPWRAEASRYCWDVIESGELPDEAHALSEVLVFLAHVPDRERALAKAPAVIDQLSAHESFHPMPRPGEYGLTPLQIAPTADSPWRRFFTDEQIGAHLDHLAAGQQEDGGWAVTWEPPSEASRLEWRGMVTVQAVDTLRSYRRL